MTKKSKVSANSSRAKKAPAKKIAKAKKAAQARKKRTAKKALIGDLRLPTPLLVFVKINEAEDPIYRATKYDIPVGEILEKENVGTVVGGGIMVDTDGTIEFMGVDVELTSLIRGFAVLIKALHDIGIPEGSELVYSLDGHTHTVPLGGKPAE